MAGFYKRCRGKRNQNQTVVVFILICSCFTCLNVCACACTCVFEVRSCRWCEVAADGFLNLTAFLLCKSAFYETHLFVCTPVWDCVCVLCTFWTDFVSSVKKTK